MVTDAALNPVVVAKLLRLRDRGYLSRRELTGLGSYRFSEPSSYSLTTAELAAHVRALRRQGWQHWEVRTRFDFGNAA